MKKFIRTCWAGLLGLACAAGLVLGTSVPALAVTPSTDTITIFHTNDMHGHLIDAYNSSKVLTTIGADYTAGIRESVPGSLLVDAGDASQGVPFANISKGADVIKLTNAMKYDLGVLGNHEFDYGLDVMFDNVRNSNYPTLSANTYYGSQPILQGVNGQGLSGNNGCDLIKTVNGVKVGFFGIETPETAYKTNPSYLIGTAGSVTFKDPVAVSQQEINTLKGEGAQVIVGVMHIGNDPMSSPNSDQIASQLTGLNVLIDGHSHTVENNVVNGTLIVQTGCYGANVGRLDITVDSNGTVTPKETLISAAQAQKDYTPDTAVQALATQLSSAQAPLFNQVVGHTSTALWGGVVNNTSIARLGESNMGDLVADAMADAAKSHVAGTEEAGLPIVALENGGGVRDSIPQGDITQGQVSTILPFGNILSMKEVTPDVLYQIIENGVSKIAGQDATTGKITGADGRFPQVSGMRFTYDPSDTPSNTAATPAVTGSRVKQIVLLNPDGSDKQVLDRNDTTTKIVLATNDYEDAGGDGYTMLSGIKNIGEGDALDVITGNYITALTKAGGGTFAYPMSQGRIRLATSYVYPDYSASVTLTDSNGAVANRQVVYSIDNTSAAYGTTDSNGVLTVSNLTSGSHTIYVYQNGNYAEAYVNNTIGMTAVTNDMSAQSSDQAAAVAVMTSILNLPYSPTWVDQTTVNTALKAYNALTVQQQALVADSAVLKAAVVAVNPTDSGSSSSGSSKSSASAAASISASSAASGSSAASSAASSAVSASNPFTGDMRYPLTGAFVMFGISGAALLVLLRKKNKRR
ncbi:5'-nucleotidase C-terminal domain-containing protein [Ethanoligenens harbinense]|uniref:5'-Nucleotidase domain-containing protein n=1 Tax=Ethanoligenens harbinense (strain DSM 18485 / JCM 12961 / CGMCC 1.5033 / YUAN-3) TaxID=663278 RepID=E6U4S6_ETHHY|nr:5'-nucleotidase C-terminal domain-containing protein [Ethanoligenens harbinense]ADU27811.1 5'-Nucleotidase domain-containing protein [Ethanoligenens harbinense YUAN-3]AVQ96836.1 bifunctional metallophosphatase/5'-nucleotidase [Ethanoligenens harbinense YUAN-3]AYF39498.1 bifunctional metallophosphatase/5'-nucleotidase [Ethanoligenens harbinense]AYF42323.1 bifunctional metallophosphatase/5'-nucleotidase [Ethanoligenens harbinense]QCN93077.1 bifunctional metallophosphatase/5'-nucleotidase [Eth